MTPLKEQIIKEFEEKFAVYEQIGDEEMIGYFALKEDKEEVKQFISQSLDRQLEEIRKELLKELEGIEKSVVESDKGWWQPNEGETFGESKLSKIKEILK
jgi:hypothetical protein